MAEDKTTEEKVKRRAREAYRILAENLGIKLSERDYPNVTFTEGSNSSYDGETRTINITPKDQDSAIAYFEEASHALRDLCLRKKLPYRFLPYNFYTDPQVQEFYGRIGETLGRHFSKGTEFEELFAKESPRNCSSPERRKIIAEYLKIIGKERKKTRRRMEAEKAFDNFLKSDLYSARRDAVNILELYYRGKIDRDEAKYRLQETIKMLIERAKKYSPKELNGEELGDFAFQMAKNKMSQNFSDLASLFLMLKDDEVKKEDLKNKIKEMKKNIGGLEMDISLDSTVRNLDLFAEEYRIRTHANPYRWAEQYSPEELLSIPNLYGLRNSEVRRRLMRRKESSSIESKLSFFGLFFIGFLIYLIGFSFTGNVVLNNDLEINGNFILIPLITAFFIMLVWHLRKYL